MPPGEENRPAGKQLHKSEKKSTSHACCLGVQPPIMMTSYLSGVTLGEL
jgi:hypothetical protein